MPLELINTIAALTTAAVIVATAVAAIAQLRHLRAGNQIAGFLTLRTMLDDDAHQRAIAVLEREGDLTRDQAYLAYTRAVFSNDAIPGGDRYREVRAAVVMIANSFEVMGTLVRNGIVDRRLFLEQYCSTIMNMWKRLEPYIAAAREIQADDGIWEDFEYLTALSRTFIAQHPSVFPKDMPRLLPSYQGGQTQPGHAQPG
jgi:hypothetical protein